MEQLREQPKQDTWGGRREGSYTRPPGPHGPYRKNDLQRLRILAQQHTENAINRIVEVMNDPNSNPMVVLAAAGMILDRGYGKAREYVTVDAHENITIEYETVESARAKLLADGIPLEALETPKLIEHVDDK